MGLEVEGSSGLGETGQNFVLRCELVSDDIRVESCGQFMANGKETFNIIVEPNKQCITGTATLQLWIEDEFTESPKQDVIITISNVCPVEKKLVPATLEKLDQFGAAVALEGLNAVIVAPGDDGVDNTKSKVGAAYVYNLVSGIWNQGQKLLASDGAANDSMSSVAINGNLIVVGAPYNKFDYSGVLKSRGAAYVFKNNGSGVWSEVAKLVPTGGNSTGFDNFGSSVSVSGNTIAVGAPGDGPAENGAVYVFTYDGTNWVQQQKIISSSSLNNLGFGTSLSLVNNTLVVGAPMAPLSETFGTGLAFVYNRSGSIWSETKVLTPPATLANGARFGSDVDLYGEWIAIGADRAVTATGNTGAAYLSRLVTGVWGNPQILTETLANPGDEFGFSIAVHGTNLVVGSRYNNNRRGAAYYYTWNSTNSTWVRKSKLISQTAKDLDQFGSDVDLFGANLLVGARLDDEKGSGTTDQDGSGSASVITLP